MRNRRPPAALDASSCLGASSLRTRAGVVASPGRGRTSTSARARTAVVVRWSLVAVFLAACALGACGDDGEPATSRPAASTGSPGTADPAGGDTAGAHGRDWNPRATAPARPLATVRRVSAAATVLGQPATAGMPIAAEGLVQSTGTVPDDGASRGALSLALAEGAVIELGSASALWFGTEAPAEVVVLHGRCRATLSPQGNSPRPPLRIATAAGVAVIGGSGDVLVAALPSRRMFVAVLGGMVEVHAAAALEVASAPPVDDPRSPGSAARRPSRTIDPPQHPDPAQPPEPDRPAPPARSPAAAPLIVVAGHGVIVADPLGSATAAPVELPVGTTLASATAVLDAAAADDGAIAPEISGPMAERAVARLSHAVDALVAERRHGEEVSAAHAAAVTAARREEASQLQRALIAHGRALLVARSRALIAWEAHLGWQSAAPSVPLAEPSAGQEPATGRVAAALPRGLRGQLREGLGLEAVP